MHVSGCTGARRRVAAVLALALAASGLAVAVASPAPAAPGKPYAAGDDGEGGSKSLTDQLDAATRGFLAAQDALAASRRRQQQLARRLSEIDAQLAPRQAALDAIVAREYRSGRLGAVSALLQADTTDGFLDRAEALEAVAVKQNQTTQALRDSRAAQLQAKAAIDVEVRNQQRQVNVMSRRKAQVENALKAAGGGGTAAAPSGGGGGRPAVAAAVPRRSDGSLAPESCSIDDPTTTGCITPRMLHALQQAKAARFTHFVSCFRPSGSGEHPKGRACDFAADPKGFGGVATGASRAYGNRLADYFIANSRSLGVLYVIWFRRIWLPSSGWKAYTHGQGDPSSEHTNHVHLSVV
jgi:peptidoglycan DL-endopeptidase CwlO